MRKRKRYQAGSVTKNKRYWLGKYRDENGNDRTKLLGKWKGPERITKSEAEEKLAEIVRPLNSASNLHISTDVSVETYVENRFLPFKRRRWKRITDEARTDSITLHIIGTFGNREVRSLSLDELQTWLDSLKNPEGEPMAFSMVDHLRWDVKAIFDLAVADGVVPRNPVYSGKMLLFVPRHCPRPKQPVMSADDVRRGIAALKEHLRERLIFELIVLAGMRVSEVFGLRRGRVYSDHAEIVERVCRRDVDTPKTPKSERDAALSSAVQQDLRLWLASSPDTGPDGWLFPSETLKTPIGSDNVMARNMRPQLKTVGLDWVDYRAMRRTHSSLMKQLKVDPKLVADQQGHGVDTNQNVYTMTPVESRLEAVETLSSFIN